MKTTIRDSAARIAAKSTIWKVGLYQALLLVAVVGAWRVLQSPSTMGFFVFELGVALAGGFFLSLRRDTTNAHLARGTSLESDSTQRTVFQSRRKHASPAREVLGKQPVGPNPDFMSSRRRRRIYLGLSSLFLVTVALACLYLSHSLYTAPLEFFVLVGIATGGLGVNTWVNGEKHAASLLAQIVILATLVKFYFLYLNPYLYTSDSYLFFLGLHDVATTGFLQSSLGHYYFFPGFATFAFSAARIGAVPLEFFTAFGFASQIAMIPIVFLLGRRLGTNRVGLFTSLFAIFSVFMFLFTQVSATYYGIVFVFLAIYAAVQIGGNGRRVWFGIFWLSAIVAMISHPINALILALILGVRVAMLRTTERGASARNPSLTPAFSYGVIYGSYLIFVAYTAFDLFVASFFIVDYAPALATAPSIALERSPLFIVQSAIAPLGLAIPIFFAGYAVLSRSETPRSEHSFFVVLGAMFLMIPGLEFLGGNFKLQSSRMLVFLAIPLVFLAAHGLASLLHGIARMRRVATLVVAVFLVLGFAASSTYLTQNDSRVLYTEVPAASVHITESAVASRQFLNLTPQESTIYMEAGTWRYFADSDRARDPLLGRSTLDLAFFQEAGGSGFVVLNSHFLAYGNPSSGGFYDLERVAAQLQDHLSMLIYDSGTVSVYFAA